MAQAEGTKDTMPKRGRVNEVCREWLVKEDGALAYRLQNEEIEYHYTGNKSRNAQVREDIPHARDEQIREEEEAAILYAQQVYEQEERDALVAKQLADRIEHEERQRKLALEEEDADIARRLQERERQQIERKERERLEYNREINSVGLPLPQQHTTNGLPDVASLGQQVRRVSLQDSTGQRSAGVNGHPQGDDRDPRRIQEEQDAELARRLQEEESGNMEASMLDQDRLMAIEAQDKELARLLQERERAKAKRARERARQKSLLKKQQEESGGAAAEVTDWSEQEQQRPIREQDQAVRATRPTDLDLSGARAKQRHPDPEAIEVLDSSSSSYSGTNIAMAIDPTYPRRATITNSSNYAAYASPDIQPSNISSPALSLPPPDFDDDDIPPYMPIQGQRRIATLEKKKKNKAKKEGKESSCKQQ